MPPHTIFIVPYRDRANQRANFLQHMQHQILNEWASDSYAIYFVHQCDKRPFNRGAMKNIGFMMVKQRYPQTYQDMTLIFHDVDTYPADKSLIPYRTSTGVVAHYFGYHFALGGIVAIKAGDFEKAGGFPNFWGWGLEDNALNDRCLQAGLKIDRSVFYPIMDQRIIRPFDGFKRVISKRDAIVYKQEKPDGWRDLTELKASFDDANHFINVNHFRCAMDPHDQVYAAYDIRQGAKMPLPKGFMRRSWLMSKR
jgi:hypothetical protein